MGGLSIRKKIEKKEKKNKTSGQGGDICHLPRQGKRDDLSSSLCLEREGPEGPLLLTKGGRLFLPCFFGYKRPKGERFFLPLGSGSTPEKQGEKRVREKRGRREKEGKKKEANLGVFHHKVSCSVCMVSFGYFNG